MDIFMDIMRILLTYKIRNQVEAINETQNSVLLRMEIIKADEIHQKAIENIEDVLEEYGYYYNGKPNVQWND